ncbi:IS3 family transposase, partial [Jeotgalibaca dankookensis]
GTVKDLVAQHGEDLPAQALLHSDQGSHYTSPIFQKLVQKNGLTQSMSRRGNCWDNAPQESYFGHLKDEIPYEECHSLKELQSVIINYMDYYNHERGQWKLKKLTPVSYRDQLLKQVA